MAEKESFFSRFFGNKKKEGCCCQLNIVKNEEKKKETIKLLNSKRIVDPEFNLVVIGLVNVLQ